MKKQEIIGPRLFVLDTNVLMHDPTALFRFNEHDVFLPMVVLEELDRSKKGVSEVARNVRQVSRFLDDLISRSDLEKIADGIVLSQGGVNLDTGATGRLLFQTKPIETVLPAGLPGTAPDNEIIAIALSLQKQRHDVKVTLVSKDINLRLKAAILGIHTEDYYNDQVLEDVDLLYRGIEELDPGFWESLGDDIRSWKEKGRSFYEIHGELIKDWHPNQFLIIKGEKNFTARVTSVDKEKATIVTTTDYMQPGQPVWSINARNLEQNFALNLLMDPEVDFVSLVGVAGTGKTLLTLAAGLMQTMDEQRYQEIIMTRVTVPVGEDIGFLPGTEEEKMTPWMGALMDNLEVLSQSSPGNSREQYKDNWTRAATNDLLQHRIKIRSLNFMRGRTFLNRFIILDEAQNLTPKQMKTLITRAGPGTKIVCLGNVAQIDTPYLTETNSGLTYVVDRFKYWEYSGHITLHRGERSRLADFASDNL